MVDYTPQVAPPIPSNPDLLQLSQWAQREFRQLSQQLTNTDTVQFNVQYVAPDRPRDGMVVWADGTHWNPGFGAGPYTYFAGVWYALAPYGNAVPAFSAYATTNQNGFPYQAQAQILFPLELYDIGSHYNTGTSLWTPPAGKVFMTAASFSAPDGGGTPLGCVIYIYKNGGLRWQSAGSASFGVNGATISVEDVATGTDTYGIWKIDNQSIAGGTSTVVAGGGGATYFMGHWISP